MRAAKRTGGDGAEVAGRHDEAWLGQHSVLAQGAVEGAAQARAHGVTRDGV